MHLAALAPFLSLLPILSLASPAATTPRPLLASRQAPSTCNGHAELCERSYGNVTFIGAHNSYGNGNSVMHNQGKDVVEQLVSWSGLLVNGAANDKMLTGRFWSR